MYKSIVMKLSILFLSVGSATLVMDNLPDGLYTMDKCIGPSCQPRPHPQMQRRCIGRDCTVYSPTTPYGKFLKDRMPFPHDHKSFCYSNETFPTSDFHEALNLLFQSPLFWIPKESARFAIYGDAVAYICNLMDWNTGSLTEYMEAMRILDESCGSKDPSVQTPAKLAMPKYDLFYGREIRGKAICRMETDASEIKNEAQNVDKFGCKEYANGLVDTERMDFFNRCNNAAERTYWDRIKKAFPWYRHD